MKKLLILLAVVLLAACNHPAKQTSRSAADWIYVSTTGNDGTGDGTSGKPYLTIATGISHASAGDTVFVVAGTYTITTKLSVPVDICLMGEGATSIIIAGSALDPMIELASASEGTNGNQTISYLYVDGDLTAVSLVEVYGRSNVDIHHCTFIDAAYEGVRFHGRVDDNYQFATARAAGNSFHDNIVINCATYDTGHAWDKGRGNLCFGGQTGFLIYNNTITQPDRGTDANGHGIKFCNWGEHFGTKIYSNTISVPAKKGSGATYGYAFAFELWSQRGGVEIYDNDIHGTVDFGGYDTNDDGDYGYAMRFYRNRLYLANLSAVDHWGILLEQGLHDGIYIYQNRFTNYSRPVSFATSETALMQGQEDVYFYANIFDNVRRAGAGWYGYCFDINFGSTTTVDHLQILNNTVNAPASTMYAFIQSNDSWTTFTNMVVRNNIVMNAHACVEITNGTVTTINVDNNDFYNTSHTTDYTGATVTGNTFNNNLISDPLFKSNETFRLRPISPAINAGIDVGLTTDYWGHKVPQNDIIDIGACEFGNYVLFYGGKQLY